MKSRIEEVLRNRILFIGGPEDEIPQIPRTKGVQVYLGCPNDLIDELVAAVGSTTPTPDPELCAECKTRGIPGTSKFNWPLCDECIKRRALATPAPTTPTPPRDLELEDVIGKALRQLEKFSICESRAAKELCAQNAKTVLASAWLDILKKSRREPLTPAPHGNDRCAQPGCGMFRAQHSDPVFNIDHKFTEPATPTPHVSVAYNHETGEKIVTPDPCHEPAIQAELAAAATNLILAKSRMAKAKRAAGVTPAPQPAKGGKE